MTAYVGIPCIEPFLYGRNACHVGSSTKLPSFAKVVFSADANLGDGVVAVAMQKSTCGERLRCIGWSMVSDDKHQDDKGISCCQYVAYRRIKSRLY